MRWGWGRGGTETKGGNGWTKEKGKELDTEEKDEVASNVGGQG